jgi:4-amino-4-deoxy-L-arabinose transferase-like glycosyltransferase
VPDAPAERGTRRALTALVALVGAACLVVAVTVPFHATDALIYGLWSRLLADHGGFHFAELSNAYYHRPLLYVAQGELWRLFGVHEWIGRLLALGFGAGLVLTTAALADAGAGLRRAGRSWGLAGAFAAVALLASPDVAQLAFSGLTDVPVAALCGLVAVALWSGPGGRWRPALIALAAGAAVLAKPSGIPAVLALGLAHLLVGPRAELRDRVLRGCLPVALGLAAALAYDLQQAHSLGESLPDFLKGALPSSDPLMGRIVDFYAELNRRSAREVVLAGQWLGPYLTLPLLFGLGYGLLRAAGVTHRSAATVAAPAAALGSWLAPVAAGHGLASGPFDPQRPVAAVVTIAFAAVVWQARRAPAEAAPDRDWYRRMLIWVVPTALAWVVQAPSNTRYLAPAWPALFALAAVGLVVVARGAATRRAWAVPAIGAVLAVAAVADLRNLDSLRSTPDGDVNAVTFVRSLSVDDVLHPERMRAAADPQLGGALAVLRPLLGAEGRLVTGDGRLGFFFPGRTRRIAARRCADLRGAAAFALLDATRNTQQLPSDVPGTAFWSRCRSPRTRLVARVPGSYAVFAVGGR